MDRRQDSGFLPHNYFNRVKNASHLFHGITDRTMPIDEARRFLECGMFLERAKKRREFSMLSIIFFWNNGMKTLSLDQHMDGSTESVDLSRLSVKRTGLELPLQRSSLSLSQPDFPSSICYAVRKAERALRGIGGSTNSVPLIEQSAYRRLMSDLTFMTTEDILQEGLHPFLDTVQSRCNEIAMQSPKRTCATRIQAGFPFGFLTKCYGWSYH